MCVVPFERESKTTGNARLGSLSMCSCRPISQAPLYSESRIVEIAKPDSGAFVAAATDRNSSNIKNLKSAFGSRSGRESIGATLALPALLTNAQSPKSSTPISNFSIRTSQLDIRSESESYAATPRERLRPERCLKSVLQPSESNERGRNPQLEIFPLSVFP